MRWGLFWTGYGLAVLLIVFLAVTLADHFATRSNPWAG